jgi:hypothetical protein
VKIRRDYLSRKVDNLTLKSYINLALIKKRSVVSAIMDASQGL